MESASAFADPHAVHGIEWKIEALTRRPEAHRLIVHARSAVVEPELQDAAFRALGAGERK